MRLLGDLLLGADQQVGQLAVAGLVGRLVGDREPAHAGHLELVDRLGAELVEFLADRLQPHAQLLGRVLDADPARQVVLGDPLRRDLRVDETAHEDRRMRLLHRLPAEAARSEVGELAVVLERLVRPDALADLDRLTHVGVATREDVGGARGGELLGHPASADTDVDPTARQVVDGGDLGGEHARATGTACR